MLTSCSTKPANVGSYSFSGVQGRRCQSTGIRCPTRPPRGQRPASPVRIVRVICVGSSVCVSGKRRSTRNRQPKCGRVRLTRLASERGNLVEGGETRQGDTTLLSPSRSVFSSVFLTRSGRPRAVVKGRARGRATTVIRAAPTAAVRKASARFSGGSNQPVRRRAEQTQTDAGTACRTSRASHLRPQRIGDSPADPDAARGTF